MPDVSTKRPHVAQEGRAGFVRCYWSVLDTEEKALLAFEPTRRMVPTTNTKITASITAYSAMSCPLSSLKIWGRILISLQFLSIVKTRTLGATLGSRTLNLIPLGDCAPAT